MTDSKTKITQAKRDAQMARKDTQNAHSAAVSAKQAKIAKAKSNMTPEQLADHEARLAHRMSTNTSKHPTNKS